eukprot:7272297-Lingulodinium_polyedra.AAC.1
MSTAFLKGRRVAVGVGILSQDSTRPGDPARQYAVEKHSASTPISSRARTLVNISCSERPFTRTYYGR